MLKKYNTLLFDIDDTLLDFQLAQRQAFKKLLEVHNVEFSEEILKKYDSYNKNLWNKLEIGELSREELLSTRFSGFFKLLKVEPLNNCDDTYRNFLSEGDQLFPGVLDLLEKLKNTHNLYIVTNGIADTQKNRIKNNKLNNYFKNIFISEEIGFQKPNIKFFEKAFEKIEYQIDKNKTLIIGDSLSADIKGGQNIGIDTCWINPNSLINTLENEPTFIIKNVTELMNID